MSVETHDVTQGWAGAILGHSWGPHCRPSYSRVRSRAALVTCSHCDAGWVIELERLVGQGWERVSDTMAMYPEDPYHVLRTLMLWFAKPESTLHVQRLLAANPFPVHPAPEIPAAPRTREEIIPVTRGRNQSALARLLDDEDPFG